MEDFKTIGLFLKRVRLRLYFKNLIKILLYSLTAGFILTFFVQVLIRLVPLTFGDQLSLFLLISSILTGLLISYFKRPSLFEAALFADSKKLKERTLTALELKEDDSAFAKMQREDTALRLKEFDINREVSIKPERRVFLIPLIALILLTITVIIPNPKRDEIAFLKKLSQTKKEEIKKVEEIEKEVQRSSTLKEYEKKEIENKLSELKKDIKLAKNIDEIKDLKDKSANKIYSDINKDKDLSKIEEALNKNKETSELSKALSSKDSKKISEEIDKLNEKLAEGKISQSDLGKISEDLKSISKDIKDESLKNSINSLSDGIKGDKASEELENFKAAVDNAVNNPSKSEMKTALNKISGNLNEGSDGEEGSGTKGEGSGAGKEGQGGNGEEGKNGNGQEGKGTGGGAGEGSTLNEGQGSSSSGIGEKGPSEKKVLDYEKIYVPKNLGGDGKQEDLTGSISEGGKSQIIKYGEAVGDTGYMIPYNRVYGIYKDMAYERLDSFEVPLGMTDLIKMYFSSLED